MFNAREFVELGGLIGYGAIRSVRKGGMKGIDGEGSTIGGI
jgi:hypothetical protein